MYTMEDAVWELFGAKECGEHGLPPGFRSHPTDEELITYYLASKVFNGGLCGVDMVEVDLNMCEPWEIPDVARMGEREWYFFSLRDRKYPTGLRTNRATGAGYWKATGKDREVHSASTGALLGMKKTLVFYNGRVPRGEKTKWVLHEYRLEGDFSCRHTCKEEWVICRIFNKSGMDKSPYYPYPNYMLDSSSSFSTSHTPSFQTLRALQTLQNQIQPYHPYLHEEPTSLFPISLPHRLSPAPILNLPQEELFSSWIDTNLHNPLFYEMGLGFPGFTVHDLPLGVPYPAEEPATSVL